MGREREREREQKLGAVLSLYWDETRKIVKAAWSPTNPPTNGYKKNINTNNQILK